MLRLHVLRIEREFDRDPTAIAVPEVLGRCGQPAAGNRESVTFSTLGVRAATSIELAGMRLATTATLGWRHAFGDVTPDSVLHFAGGETFDVQGVPIARDAGVAKAGIELHPAENISLGVSYASQFANRSTDQSANVTLGIRF